MTKDNDDTESNHITHAHDRVFKLIMQDKQVAKEFFQASLPKEILEKINWDVFELQPGSYVDRRHKELIADVLYLTEIDGKPACLYLLVCHQSSVDKLMSFWVLQYTCNIIDKHIKDHQIVPFVIPLVVYHGKQPWSASNNINDFVNADRELVDKYFLRPFQLIDLNKITDEELKERVRWGALAITLKHIYENDMKPYLPMILDLLKLVQETENGKIFAEGITFYILTRGEINRKEFEKQIQAKLSSEIGENVMTVAEQYRQEGLQKGLQKAAIILDMMSRDENTQTIAQKTGLSVEEVELFKRSITTH